MNDQEIKALIPVNCPHCKKTIVLEFITNAPTLSSVYTPEMIEMAKVDAINKINMLQVDGEIKNPVIEWINNPETIFGPNDVEEIVRNVQKTNPNESKEE